MMIRRASSRGRSSAEGNAMHRSPVRHILGLLAFAAAGLLSACTAPESPACPPVLEPQKGPWVLTAEPGVLVLRWESLPTDFATACLSWTRPDGTTLEPAVSSRIRIGSQPLVESAAPYADSGSFRLYEAIIEVDPDTEAGVHRWRIETGTAPVTGSVPVVGPETDGARVLLIGDSNNAMPTTVPNATTDLVTAQLGRYGLDRGVDLYAHAGDLAYQASFPVDSWQGFWINNRPLLRAAPLIAATGNHEYEYGEEWETYVRPWFSSPLTTTAGSPHVLAWDVGRMRMITFNSNLSKLDEEETAAMWARVEELLEGVGDRWTALLFHHPIYTTSTHSPKSGIRDTVLDLDERYGIDLVLTGHNHVYERFSTPHLHAIVSGGGGAGLYGLDLQDEGANPDAVREAAAVAFNMVHLTVNEEAVLVEAVDGAGRIIERADLDRR